MSFFQVKNYADEFAAALEGKALAAPTVEEEDETISVVADDIDFREFQLCSPASTECDPSNTTTISLMGF